VTLAWEAFNPHPVKRRGPDLNNLQGRGTKISVRSYRDIRRADHTVGFLPSYHARNGVIVYQCFKCGAKCDGPASFCAEHMAVELRP
jgi:hypothetical protein